ncbi:hypothetical protein ACJH6H_29695 [Mycobacterium sp. SMC-21]|uniref:hypothetical protein n=1 Tax=Mycobacterium sp. SMC-21 TaxID=3381632 RepID=UPI003877221D
MPDDDTAESDPVSALKGKDREWTKTATVVISTIALCATISSAVAAWQSWRTARAAETVARDSVRIADQALAVSGAVPSSDSTLELVGGCYPRDALTAKVTLHNSGHLATQVHRLELSMDYRTKVIVGGGGGGGTWAPEAIGYLPDVNVTVPPQDSVTIQLPIKCEQLNEVVRKLDAATDLANLISGKNVTIGDPNQYLWSVNGEVYLNADFGTGPGSRQQIISATIR